MSQPLILHIETSGKNCSVAISEDSTLRCLCEEMTENFSHSQKLHTFIQWAIEGAETDYHALDAISVSEGPGSYTGLRIGAAAAKGLAFALGIPLITTQSLKTLATPHFQGGYDTIFANIDARRDEVFYQVFTRENSESAAQNALLDLDLFSPFEHTKTLVVGSGTQKIKSFIEKHPWEGKSEFCFLPEEKISAQYAIPEALYNWEQKEFVDVAYFEPNYVKSVHITQKKKV